MWIELVVFCRICFGVAEILLLAALSVESGHLKNWSKPRTGCYSIREGLFSAAGVLALTTVFLAAGLYLTALRAQKMVEEVASVRREVLEASALYASPPRSPQPQYMSTVSRENTTSRENHNELLLSVFPTPFVKSYDFAWIQKKGHRESGMRSFSFTQLKGWNSFDCVNNFRIWFTRSTYNFCQSCRVIQEQNLLLSHNLLNYWTEILILIKRSIKKCYKLSLEMSRTT